MFFLLPFLLSSCTSAGSWFIQNNRLSCCSYQACKLSNQICNPFRDIKLEITKTLTDWQACLIMQSIPLSYDEEGETTCSIRIFIDEEEIVTQGYVYRGGQKVGLEDEVAIHIINALSRYQCVKVQVGRYCGELSPEGFDKALIQFRDCC